MNTFLTNEELTAIANEIDPGNIKGSHISIDPKKFDTKLPEERREEFNEWKRAYAPNDSGVDYDLQGAFLEGMTPGEDGHFPDKYKKPNHPTFSNESKYATGVMAELAGHWTPNGEYIPSPYVHLVHNRIEGWKHNGPGLVYLVGKDGKRVPFKAPKGGVTGEWAAGEVRKHIDSNLAWVNDYVPGAKLEQMIDGVKLYMAMRNYRNRYELGERRAPQFRDAMLKIEDWGLHGSDLTDFDVIRSVIQSSLANVEKEEDFRRGYRDMMTYIAPLLKETSVMPTNLYEYVTDKKLRTRMENTQRVILEQDRADEAVRRKRIKSRVARRLVNTGDYAYAEGGDSLSGFLKRHKLTEAQLDALNADNPDYKPGVLSVSGSGKYPLRVKQAKKDPRETQQAAEAGDTEGPEVTEVPAEEPVPQATEPAPEGGPRIVINPEVFEDKRDALCVAMNEAFRVLMEVNGFNPVSEPTEAQRQFFSDTAYSKDENQMRRTILARICTFDTSVKDPTNEQIDESVEFLEAVMEMGAPQNEWEQQAVQRIHDVLRAALETGAQTSEAPAEEEAPVDVAEGDIRQEQADVGGGTSGFVEFSEEEREKNAQEFANSAQQAKDLSNTNFVTFSEEEREKNAQEFANSAQQAKDLSNTNFVTFSEEEREKNAQEFMNSVDEPGRAPGKTVTNSGNTSSASLPSAQERHTSNWVDEYGRRRNARGQFLDERGGIITERRSNKINNLTPEIMAAMGQQNQAPSGVVAQGARATNWINRCPTCGS